MNKAKQEVERLVERFRMHDIMITDLMGDELPNYEENHYKKCALICVEEIMRDREKDLGNPDAENDIENINYLLNYWQQVKQAIQEL